MHLWALSDLHLAYPNNREALQKITPRPDDWLILAGDLGERLDHLRFAFDTLGPRFAQLIWVPGNHELYSLSRDLDEGVGVEKYNTLVALCEMYGVLTPEDPYTLWPGEGPPTRIAPLFIGYDYSFGPEGLSPEEVLRWAAEEGIRSTDEELLRPDPFPSRAAWCQDRVARTEARLKLVPAGQRLVLINHYPLRRDLVRIPRIPRFVPWCGTRLTEDWHTRFPVDVVVTGHLHVRATDWIDGVRFEEVSLGYPRHWRAEAGAEHYLRQILPRVPAPPGGRAPMVYHR